MSGPMVIADELNWSASEMAPLIETLIDGTGGNIKLSRQMGVVAAVIDGAGSDEDKALVMKAIYETMRRMDRGIRPSASIVPLPRAG